MDKTVLVLPLRDSALDWVSRSLEDVAPPSLLFLSKLNEIIIRAPNKKLTPMHVNTGFGTIKG